MTYLACLITLQAQQYCFACNFWNLGIFAIFEFLDFFQESEVKIVEETNIFPTAANLNNPVVQLAIENCSESTAENRLKPVFPVEPPPYVPMDLDSVFIPNRLTESGMRVINSNAKPSVAQSTTTTISVINLEGKISFFI